MTSVHVLLLPAMTCPGEPSEMEPCGDEECPGFGFSVAAVKFMIMIYFLQKLFSSWQHLGWLSMRHEETRGLIKRGRRDVTLKRIYQVSFDQDSFEQPWIGKLQLATRDFYVQDCSATLVGASKDLLLSCLLFCHKANPTSSTFFPLSRLPAIGP